MDSFLNDVYRLVSSDLEVGDLVEGRVTGVTNSAVHIRIADDIFGAIPVEEVSYTPIRYLASYLRKGQPIRAKIIKIVANNSYVLSLRQLQSHERVIESNLRKDDKKVKKYNLDELFENYERWLAPREEGKNDDKSKL